MRSTVVSDISAQALHIGSSGLLACTDTTAIVGSGFSAFPPPRGGSTRRKLGRCEVVVPGGWVQVPSFPRLAQESISTIHGVTEDRLSGDTLRVGVLLDDSDAGRKKGAAISVEEVSPWLRSCKICRSKAFPSSLVSLNAQHF